MTTRVPEIQRVKIVPELVEILSKDWSEPVQVMIGRTDEDGDLELIFRTVPPEEGESNG